MLGCYEGDIRLVGDGNDMEGRVEICLHSEWGTVCDQMWDTTDSSVVCRQLGLTTSGTKQNKNSYNVLIMIHSFRFCGTKWS